MVDFSRSASGGHVLRGVGALALLAAAGCSGGGGGTPEDETPPVFAGLESATVTAPGVAHLAWSAAEDESGPVTYLVYASGASESFDLATPVATTEALALDVADLPQGALPTWFLVRARDAAGNVDGNTEERSVAFADNRLTLLAHFETPIASDIAVHSSGHLVAMGGFVSTPQVRAWIFDVNDPANPQLKQTIYGPGRSTDVEIRGNVLWVSTEDDPSVPQAGAYAYDITDPDAISQTPIGSVSGMGVGQCHTIWLDADILYCASSDDGDIHLVNVANPAAPVYLSSVGMSGSQVHDMYVGGGVAVGAFLWDGFAFFDASDPSNPTLEQLVTYQNAFSHNAWPTADGRYLYTTDENEDGHLRIWDIQDRNDVRQVGDYWADPGAGRHAIAHNVQIVGNLAYVAWYEAGVHVLDVTDPTDPVLVGFHDTFSPATQGWFAGAWGVAPSPPYVYVSDISSGLWTFRLEP